MFTKEFWKAVAIRAIRTACQSALGIIGSSVVLSDVNWTVCVSAVALSTIVSVLMSIATGLPEA